MSLTVQGRRQSLTPELSRLNREIERYAREYGLDFYETFFEVLDFEEMNMVAAYGGFPNRYPHWKFGMEYERLNKSYAYGLHKIYEMVINNDPCYAYLLECNHLVDQKIVMAHVYGHCDFFKNNIWFSKSNRKMMDSMANHATKIRKYIDKHGLDVVEGFIDICLSIDDLIDHHSVFIERKFKQQELPEEPIVIRKIASSEYMDDFINPREFMEQQRQKLEEERQRRKRFPEEPQKDVLLFLTENAPLANWQRDVLWMIREEAYYFAPQAQTKIMNEGWATYWHAKIMTERALNDAEVIDFADHHSGTVAAHPGQINPYRLGFELWKDIEDRWNKGKFGKDYDECDDYGAKCEWDLRLGAGREKIFETRRVHNDITFIDAFFTEEFCHQHKFFTYAFNPERGVYEITDRNWRSVKQKLLRSLTNFGQPFIYVNDGNFENRGELLLEHRHEGVDLRVDYAKDTLTNLHSVWSRPVHLRTIVEGKGKMFTYDGEKHIERKIDG
ncbi:MAG: SpoVR family protein [Acidobacteria bacterium]|nr:MAG: SpoVR family protein [Acidobacteriota bacterium]